MEVTRWDFDSSECRSINLFADGSLGSSYLLTDTAGFRMPPMHAPAPAAPPI